MINRLNYFIIAYEKVFHFQTLFTNKFKIFVIRIFNKYLLIGLVKKEALSNSDTIGKLFSLSNTGKEGVNLSFDFT